MNDPGHAGDGTAGAGEFTADSVDVGNFGDHVLGTGIDTDVAVVEGSHRYTYAQLRSAADLIGTDLSGRGLADGDRVALLGANSFFWVAAYLAVIRAGLVAVPLSDKIPVADLRRNLDLVGCDTVMMDRRLARRLGDSLGTARTVITEEILIPGRVGTADGPRRPSGHDPDADATLMFTSGSTARPRVVRVTHRNLVANTNSIVEYLGLRRDDRALIILPFFYCYGVSLLHTHLRVGARVVFARPFTYPETVLDQLEEEHCTVLAGVPSSFQLLLRASSFASRSLPTLRIIQQAGGRLPPVQVDEMLSARNTARLFIMYGQTEATARLSYLPPEFLLEKKASIGRGIPGVRLRVLDDHGRDVPVGERGEIYATGENISPGYLGDPEGTAERFTPWGLRTGDLATVDEDGFLFVVDRRADFIKSWGHRISSQEIEACVLRDDRVVAAAAVGVPDDEAGEAVAVFVQARPGATPTPTEILDLCRRHLAKHMVPRQVRILDTLPLNDNGKVSKPALRGLSDPSVGTGGPDPT
jgi:acyl-CoA synthetase (AMP-forming)/AMP-acid ligase II